MKTLHTIIIITAMGLSFSSHAQLSTKYGEAALQHNNTSIGIYNSAFGYYSLNANVNGTKNTAFGALTLRVNTGSYNTAVGYASMYKNTSGFENIAFGHYSLFSNTTGYYNTALGTAALQANTTAYYNTAIGYHALFSNTDQSYNTALGPNALYTNTDGWSNTGIGYSVLFANTSGNSNTGMGHGALYLNTTGSANNAIGRYALYNNTTGFSNNAFGYGAMYVNKSGSNNTAFGHNALYNDSTGSGNTAIGYSSLTTNKTGTYNTTLGYGADVTLFNLTNATAIGNGARVDASNKVRVGNALVTSIGGQVGWSIFSDGRFKANVKENVAGLDFIVSLRPVTYNLNVKGISDRLNENRKEIADDKIVNNAEADNVLQNNAAADAASKIVYSGFIAQEVEAAAKKINYDFSGVDKPQTKDGLYGLRYDNFIVPIVKAIQELAQKNEALAQQNDSLLSRVARLEQKQSMGKLTAVNEASLEQNRPNPFNGTTLINYHIPASVNSAQLLVTNGAGVTVKTILLTGKTNGQLAINAGELASGNYFYTLITDGKNTGSKQMMIIK